MNSYDFEKINGFSLFYFKENKVIFHSTENKFLKLITLFEELFQFTKQNFFCGNSDEEQYTQV